ncbi:hypothetical protein WICPIJ_002201 [Wickerhamomyces pijperi]|uniref:Uncharacterized protein n=1 Tax=Wickerhamomyces pijperi TaxID=599730 RepID=A0A9P8QCA5_WICPI|nr:hypothetical protein WICPIJ_002201 [Wickerhamomyces pijperi]
MANGTFRSPGGRSARNVTPTHNEQPQIYLNQSLYPSSQQRQQLPLSSKPRLSGPVRVYPETYIPSTHHHPSLYHETRTASSYSLNSKDTTAGSSPHSQLQPQISPKNFQSAQDPTDMTDKRGFKGIMSKGLSMMKRGKSDTALTQDGAMLFQGQTVDYDARKLAQYQDQRPGSHQMAVMTEDDDNISLMPTLAIGFENSLANYDFQNQPQPKYNNDQLMTPKKPQPQRRKRKELRITDEGYYFAYESTPDPSNAEVGKTVQQEEVEEAEANMYLQEHNRHYLSKDQIRHTSSSYPSPPTSPMEAQYEPQELYNNHNNVDVEAADLTTLLSHIPIISQANQIIDVFNISQGNKVLIKGLVILFVLYEIQKVLEIISELFKFC